MSEGARVRSVESLRPLRAGLLEFCRESAAVLTSAESEIARMIDWLERDRVSHWRGEVQRRGELLARAKSDLYRAQIQKKSLVDEKKAIDRAKRALDEAQHRMEAARKWAVRLEHERSLYSGAVNGLNVAVSVDLPKAAAKLEVMSRSLEDYLALTGAGDTELDEAPGTVREAMSRGQPGSGMPLAEEIIRRVSGALPGALERESAPSASSAGVGLGTRRVRESVGELVSDGILDDDLRVIVDARAVREELVFLVRDHRALAGDSGWFVMPTPGSEGQPRLVATTIGAVRSAWPDLRAVWDMPPGAILALEGERRRIIRSSDTIAPDQEGLSA